MFVFCPHTVSAQVFPALSAKSVAVYGWKGGVATPLFVQNENKTYPIASITKLITAKAVEELYTPDTIFTVSKTAVVTKGSTPGIIVGAQFKRDDLLAALLLSSSNDAASVFAEKVGKKKFLATMNKIIHKYEYTQTSFINPSGLDPSKKSTIKPNRMTAYNLSRLLSDVYHDPLLVGIMNQFEANIFDIKHESVTTIRQSNELYYDDAYRDKVIIGKTGRTNLAGENLAFITKGGDAYDYITVVFLSSGDRVTDAKKIVDWLASPRPLLAKN